MKSKPKNLNYRQIAKSAAGTILVGLVAAWFFLDYQWKRHTTRHLNILDDYRAESRSIDNHHNDRLDSLEAWTRIGQ